MTTVRKLLLILPLAAFTVSPALAQTEAPKPVKPATTSSTHHHKRAHHTKAHHTATPAPAKSASG